MNDATGDIIRWMRIVLDTASFVTAVRSGSGAAGELLRMIFRKEVTLLLDLKLSLEYRDVALRSEHIKASNLSRREILELIEALEAFAEPVAVTIKLRPLSSDPNDDMVLDLAWNGRAHALVTSNKKHFLSAGRDLGVPVLSPSEVIVKIRKGKTHGNGAA